MNRTKNTYTLHHDMLDFIENHSKWLNISKSKLVTKCIMECFSMMEEELSSMRETNGYSLYKHGKKFHNTSPITLLLPEIVTDRLKYYSKELQVKKSHLVEISIYVMYEGVNIELENELKKLMK